MGFSTSLQKKKKKKKNILVTDVPFSAQSPEVRVWVIILKLALLRNLIKRFFSSIGPHNTCQYSMVHALPSVCTKAEIKGTLKSWFYKHLMKPIIFKDVHCYSKSGPELEVTDIKATYAVFLFFFFLYFIQQWIKSLIN